MSGQIHDTSTLCSGWPAASRAPSVEATKVRVKPSTAPGRGRQRTGRSGRPRSRTGTGRTGVGRRGRGAEDSFGRTPTQECRWSTAGAVFDGMACSADGSECDVRDASRSDWRTAGSPRPAAQGDAVQVRRRRVVQPDRERDGFVGSWSGRASRGASGSTTPVPTVRPRRRQAWRRSAGTTTGRRDETCHSERREPSSCGVREQPARGVDQPPLVRVRELIADVGQRHPTPTSSTSMSESDSSPPVRRMR